MSKRASKQRRFDRPYIPVKPKKRITTLHATSKGTGLRHSFKNVEGWEDYSRDIITAKVQKEEEELFRVLPFHSFLQEQNIDAKKFLVTHSGSVFRFANPLYPVTTIVGSISDGGRFNVGAAQVRADFPTLNKAGCLYTASSKECALAEAAIPHGTLKMYELTPIKKFQVWDLAGVIAQLNYPNLLDLVKASDGEALWVYRKLPAIPQLLAMKLREIGGDGIKFESTKAAGHSNIAFFFKTDLESSAAFDCKEIAVN